MAQVSKLMLNQSGPFFNLVQSTSMFGENKHMVSQNRRYVDTLYQNCRPVFSTKQDLICL